MLCQVISKRNRINCDSTVIDVLKVFGRLRNCQKRAGKKLFQLVNYQELILTEKNVKQSSICENISLQKAGVLTLIIFFTAKIEILKNRNLTEILLLWHVGYTLDVELRSYILNLSIFVGNSVDYVINCLKITRITIYWTKCLGMVTLIFLPTNCSHYNSEYTRKFPFLKAL